MLGLVKVHKQEALALVKSQGISFYHTLRREKSSTQKW